MHLERWTIDELTESTVILLRSVYNPGIDVGDTDDLTKAAISRLRQVAISLERELTSEVWEEEVDLVLDRESIADFIRTAVLLPLPEPPEPRELREGDVYWIVSKEPVPSPQDTIGPGIGPHDTKQFLAAYRERPVRVWNMTEAARQAAKETYFQAMKRAQKKKE